VEVIKTLPLPPVSGPPTVPKVPDVSAPKPPSLLQALEAKQKLIPAKTPIKGMGLGLFAEFLLEETQTRKKGNTCKAQHEIFVLCDKKQRKFLAYSLHERCQ
jgi:hypothetical protein